MGFEPTTCSLGSCHSTTELCPQKLAIISVLSDGRQAIALPRVLPWSCHQVTARRTSGPAWNRAVAVV